MAQQASLAIEVGWGSWPVVGLALAALALVLWRLINARRLLNHRGSELTALSEASRAIAAAELDIDELCVLIYRQACKIVDTWVFQLGLFEDDVYHIKVWVVRGERRPEAAFDLRDGEGIVGWLRRTRRSLLVRDFESELETLPARPRYLSDNPPRSGVFVPLVAGEEVIGAMAIQSYRPRAFTEEHQRLLSIIANQAASSIANARLYEAERRRRQIADSLQQISNRVTASLDTDEIALAVLDGLERLVAFDAAAILLWNEDHTLTVKAARGSPGLVGALGQSWSVAENRRFRTLVEDRQALIFESAIDPDPYHQLLGIPPDHACMGAPILIRDQLIGLLFVHHRQSGHYQAQDLGLTVRLAGQAASAMENARLYAEGQEEAWISTALLEVAEATSLATSVDEVLDTVVRITPLLVGVDRCFVLMWSPEGHTFEVAAVYEGDETEGSLEEEQTVAPGTWPLLDQLWESGSPVVDEFGGMLGAPDTQDVETTLMALPLRAQAELIGALVIAFTGQVSFSEHRIKLIAGIANQAALAIESAQLVVAQQEEAWVSLALLQVAEAVSSLSDLDEALAAVARLTALLVGVEATLIYLWDAEREVCAPAAAYGLSNEQMEGFRAIPIPVADWPGVSVAHSVNRPALEAGRLSNERRDAEGRQTDDGSGFWESNGQTPLMPGPPSPVATQIGLRAPAALPLLAWGKTMGVMVVDVPDEGSHLAGRRLKILVGVAQQTATAIQNAWLQEESIQRQKLEQELQLARQIQASFLPESVPQVPGWDLAAHWQGARQVSGDFFDFVPLPSAVCANGSWGFIIADVADKGMPAALFMSLSRTLVRTMAVSDCDPVRVLQQANDMIISDSRSDLFVTLFYAILDPDRAALTYANAGHNPPIQFCGVSDEMRSLAAPGIALGIVPDIELQRRETVVQPGDVVVFYTDGVTDALNHRLDEFGLERLCSTVKANRTRSAADIVAAINKAVAEFVGDTPQFDDLTLLVLKRQL